MVMETSEAVRPSCCCHVAYSGMGAEAAANTVTKATVPTMAPRIAPGGWLAACSSIPIGFPFPIRNISPYSEHPTTYGRFPSMGKRAEIRVPPGVYVRLNKIGSQFQCILR